MAHENTPVHMRDPDLVIAPNYERVARSLSDADLEDEILAGLGAADYQLALLAEHDRRSKEEPC